MGGQALVTDVMMAPLVLTMPTPEAFTNRLPVNTCEKTTSPPAVRTSDSPPPVDAQTDSVAVTVLAERGPTTAMLPIGRPVVALKAVTVIAGLARASMTMVKRGLSKTDDWKRVKV